MYVPGQALLMLNYTIVKSIKRSTSPIKQDTQPRNFLSRWQSCESYRKPCIAETSYTIVHYKNCATFTFHEDIMKCTSISVQETYLLSKRTHYVYMLITHMRLYLVFHCILHFYNCIENVQCTMYNVLLLVY